MNKEEIEGLDATLKAFIIIVMIIGALSFASLFISVNTALSTPKFECHDEVSIKEYTIPTCAWRCNIEDNCISYQEKDVVLCEDGFFDLPNANKVCFFDTYKNNTCLIKHTEKVCVVK